MDKYKKHNDIFLHRNDLVIPRGAVLLELYNVKTKKLISDLVNNMVVTAGKNSMADALRGTTANNKGIITYCALGTGITAPDLGDTGLQTEIFRKLVSVRSVVGNIATFQTFFTTSEANGSLKEAGLFGDDASGTPGSGTLFCRLAINRTKTTNDTLTLTWDVQIGS